MKALESNDESSYTVGLTYNLKKGIQTDAEDMEAEYDSIDTIYGIKNALEKAGCHVVLLEADHTLFNKLQNNRFDIVFNIAEGIFGRAREAQVPAILNFFQIPFTGSDETTLCISLDKSLTKRLLSTYCIKTPRYQVFNTATEELDATLKFPLIVKPNAEGSSKGISDCSVAQNEQELRTILKRCIDTYCVPFLVEEYISGRELTVGILGNGDDMIVIPPMEIVYKNQNETFHVYSYQVKRNYQQYVKYECPAHLDENIIREVMNISKQIYQALECRDFSRIDYRVSPEGEIYFIEINPLPGLAPGYSDFPMAAEFIGIPYDELIVKILNSALKRYGMAPIK